MAAKPTSRLKKILGRIEGLDEGGLAGVLGLVERDRSLLDSLFNVLRDGVLVADTRGRIRFLNPAAGNLLGIRPDETGKIGLWQVLPDLARTLDMAPDGRWRAVASVTRELEVIYPARRVLRVALLPLGETSLEGETLAAVILTDLSNDLARSEERVEAGRTESVMDLAAGVAHELRNPLNAINIHLQLIGRHARRAEDSPAVRKMVEAADVCRREVARLDGIISNFLGAVKPSELVLRESDALGLLEETLTTVGPELADAGVHVEVRVPGERPPSVLADPDQLKQVFFNLLKNAREAMSAGGGSLTVQAGTDDEAVILVIADNGGGMTEAELSQLFTPYFTTKRGGTGLGMMIVQRILRAHGGSVGVDSKKGAGTVVTIRLPRKEKRVRMLA